jgi:heme exporter protein D
MTIEEGARYVAAAYAIILAVLVLYYILSTRRVSTLRRDVELLEQEVARRKEGDGRAEGR